MRASHSVPKRMIIIDYELLKTRKESANMLSLFLYSFLNNVRFETRILCPTYFFYFHSNICLYDESKMVIVYSNKYLNEDGMII
jgi:hypothetical protein